MIQYLLIGQGLYYLITGIWPILNISSFEKVAGPKTDKWLVKAFGGIISVIGITLIIASEREELSPELVFLGVGSAVAFVCIDLVYVLKKVIWKTYLLDALAEVLIIIGWVIV